VVGAVGLLDNPEKACSNALGSEGDLICLLGAPEVSLGGSQYLKSCCNKVAGRLADIDLQFEKRLQEKLRLLIAEELLVSARDLSDGGLSVALAESCLAGNRGAVIDLGRMDNLVMQLFGEGPSRILISFKPGNRDKIVMLSKESSIPLTFLGIAIENTLIIKSDDDIILKLSLDEMKEAYGEVFSCIMG